MALTPNNMENIMRLNLSTGESYQALQLLAGVVGMLNADCDISKDNPTRAKLLEEATNVLKHVYDYECAAGQVTLVRGNK